MIIGIIGMCRAGKDTAALTFIKNGYKRFAFGDAVKNEYSSVSGLTMDEINGIDKEMYRPQIIKLAESRRKENPYYWIDEIKTEMINHHLEGGNVVITDVRRTSEIIFLNKLKEVYGNEVKLYYIMKPKSNGGVFDEDPLTSLAINYAHFNGSIDAVIYNNTDIEALESVVEQIIEDCEVEKCI